MEEKVTAVYLMVWKSELTPEDGDSYERPMERQKQKCIEFLKKKGIDTSGVVFHTRRADLFKDIERDKIARLVVLDTGRLAATPGDLEGALYELKMRMVELMTVEGEAPR